MSTYRPSSQIGDSNGPDSESILDASVSFGRRTTTRLPRDESVSSSIYAREQVDFLALISAIADLYTQDNVLEMQCRGEGGRSGGMAVSRGAVGEVSAVYAAFNNRPMAATAQPGRRRRYIVVLKRAADKMFKPNGDHNDADIARSFIAEIRILSHRSLRQHANIVTLLGVHWDHIDTGCPEPLLVLEKADADLASFQEQEDPDCPVSFETKKALALGIAQGLSAIHRSGVIHGDIKPENILLFRKPTLHAKIADFSHSLLDTGETRRLVGGTDKYAAPGWKRAAPTGHLLKTDVYSYGLVVSELMLGNRIMDLMRLHPPPNASWPPLSAPEMLRSLKDEDGMCRYLCNLVCLRAYQQRPKDPAGADQDVRLIVKVLKSTVVLDYGQRDLEKVISVLRGGGDVEDGHRPIQRMESLLPAEAISIPYSSLRSLSPVVMDQVVRSLQSVSRSQTDTRRGAAHMELAMCYASYIACSTLEDFSSGAQPSQSFNALVSAAALGDCWARATSHRMAQALGQPIPPELSGVMKNWLFDEAAKGSRIALESLFELDPRQAREASDTHLRRAMLAEEDQRQPHEQGNTATSTGADSVPGPAHLPSGKNNTPLHWAASTGDERQLDAILHSAQPGNRPDPAAVNTRNRRGDTPLLCAARAGRVRAVALLLRHGADATIANALGETPLHFLDRFDDAAIPAAARLLLDAGADPAHEARAVSDRAYLATLPRGGRSCARLRAVFANSPLALDALLSRAGDTTRIVPLSTDTEAALLAWALRLHHFRILEVLARRLSGSALFRDLQTIGIWVGPRRCSLVELCIMGCQGAGTSSSSGLDIPEPCVRMLHHGQDYKVALARSLEFLLSRAPGLFAAPCGGARNPLFYAIQQGHHDAVAFLASGDHAGFAPREFFRTPCDPWARCRETLGLVGRLPPWGEDDLTWDEYKHRPADPMARKDKIQTRIAQEQAVTNQRRKMGRPIWFSAPSQSLRGFGADGPLGNQGGDPDEIPGSESDDEEGRHDGCSHSSALRSIRAVSGRQNHYPSGALRAGPAAGSTFPTEPSSTRVVVAREKRGDMGIPNYRELEGEVDAVTASILYGKRKIFYDLVCGAAEETMRQPAEFPCYYTRNDDNNIGAHIHRVQQNDSRGAGDVSYRFPRQASRFSVTTSARGPEPVAFDGILRFPLLFMTLIARSIHRDLALAKLLLAIMGKLNIPDPHGWSSTSELEDACMAVDNAGGQTCPLYHASYLGWDELAILLMQRGASPGATLWFRGESHISSPRALSVLSGVFELTRNHRGEAERLLRNAAAAAGTFEQVVTADDIERLWKYPPGQPERAGLLSGGEPWENAAAYWDCDGRLTYSDLFANPPSDYTGLWDAIAIADGIQERKVREKPGSIVVRAARHRDVTALRVMVRQMGLDPNRKLVEWGLLFKVPRVADVQFHCRLTALEVVSCSAGVPDQDCSERGLELKRLDVAIVQLLVAGGALVRKGWLARNTAERFERQNWYSQRAEIQKDREFEEALEDSNDWDNAEDWYPH